MPRPRWIPRRSQWNLGHLIDPDRGLAMFFALSQFSSMLVSTLAVGAAIAVLPWLMARHGFKLVDIATVMAIALLTLGFLVPAMVQIRYRTAGKRTFPIPVAARRSPRSSAD